MKKFLEYLKIFLYAAGAIFVLFPFRSYNLILNVTKKVFKLNKDKK